MKKDIYKGLNPIYESLMSEEKESPKGDKSKQANDAVSTVSTILNTMFSILLSSKMENSKTSRGFQEIKNKILGTNNFGSFRQYILSLVDSLGAMDLAQKDAYRNNTQFLTTLFSNIEPLMSDEKLFKSAKNDIIAKLLNNFEEDLKQREAQIRKTNPDLLSQVVKSGLVVKEAKKTGDETSAEDEASRGTAFNKSRNSLDAALAFVGDVDRDKYTPALKDNADIKRYKDIADGLYKKAQDLQMLDRKGLNKIVTPSGEIKRGDYVKQQDSLLNEIIRQKREYNRIKDAALKQSGLTPPPFVDPVCPPGKKYDASKGICVDAATGGTPAPTPTPTPSKECTFPVKLKTKCNEVGTLQGKLMELIPSVKTYLSGKGKADKIYGKGTAAVSNIVWGYLSNNYGQALTSDLTKEMYDAIMALKPEDIDLDVPASAIKDSKRWEMSVSQKIEEREQIKRSKVLSFSDFFDVIEESYAFARMDEEDKVEAAAAVKKLKDSCIKDSLAQGKVVDCSGITRATGGGGGATRGEETDETGLPTREEWKGYKPVQDGAYTIFYDESWSDWWGDIAKGAAVAGIIVGGVVLAVGSGGLAIPGVAATIAAVGSAGTAVGLGAVGAGTLTIAVGAIGGTAVAKWAGSDRQTVTVLVYNGYIENLAVNAMAKGLANSLSGTVSSPDLLAIMSTLILCRGTYTDNGDGKAVSVWSQIKENFQTHSGETIESSIQNITGEEGVGGFFKDVVTDMSEIPSLPRFKTKDPLSGNPSDFDGALEACKQAVSSLNKNSSKISENIKNVTEKDLELMSEAMEEITDGVSASVEDTETEESEE